MLTKYLPVIFVCLLVTASAWGVTYSGRVVSDDAAICVDELLVKAMPHGADDPDSETVQVTTNKEGHFKLAVTSADPDTQYMLWIEDETGHVYVGYTHLRRKNDFGEIKITRGCELSGTVQTEEGASLPNIEVNSELRLQGCTHYVPAVAAITDDAGDFIFDDLSPGEYRLTVKDPRFLESECSVEVSDNFSFASIQLSKGFLVTGTALDPDGKPIAGIQVSAHTKMFYVLDPDEVASTETTDSGTYTLGGLEEGTYQMQAAGVGYVSEPIEVEFTEGQQEKTAAVDLHLIPAATLKLVFVPEEKKVVMPKQVTVMLYNEKYDMKTFEETVVDSTVIIENLFPQTYFGRVSGDEITAHGINLDLISGETVEETITLPRLFRFSGKVIDKDGSPLANTSVSIQSDDVSDDTITNNFGEFVFTSLPLEKYKLYLKHRDTIPLRKKLTLTKEGTFEDTFTMDYGLSISGKVVRSDGSMVSDMIVRAKGKGRSGGNFNLFYDDPITTSEDGSFTIKGLEDSSYDLIFGDGDDFKKEEVAAGTDDVVMTLPSQYTISGIVVNEDGDPLAEVDIYIDEFKMERSGFKYDFKDFETTDDEGKFSFDLNAGKKYQIRGCQSPYLMARIIIDLEDNAAPPGEPLQLVMKHGVSVSGTVTNADGTPAQGLFVGTLTLAEQKLYIRDDGWPPSSLTSDDGRFLIEHIQPGVEKLYVFPHIEKQNPLGVATVLIGREGAEDISIALPKHARLEGKVVTVSGKPMKEQSLYLWSIHNRQIRYRVATDDNGSFLIDKIVPGLYCYKSYNADRTFRLRQKNLPVHRIFLEPGSVHELTINPFADDAGDIKISGKVMNGDRPFLSGEINFFLLPDLHTMTHDEIYSLHHHSRETKIQGDGKFEVIFAKPGTYSYSIRNASIRGELFSAAMSAEINGITEISEGDTAIVLATGTAIVEGTVTDAHGNPVLAAEVSLQPIRTDYLTELYLRQETKTDKKGSYSLRYVPPGMYRLLSGEDKLGSYLDSSVEIKEGRNKYAIAIPEGNRIYGTIHNSVEGEVDETVVSVNYPDEHISSYFYADINGNYLIEPPPPPGEYFGFATREGYAVEYVPIHLNSSQQIDYELVTAGKAHIRLKGNPGNIASREIILYTESGTKVMRSSDMLNEYNQPFTSFFLPLTDRKGITTCYGLHPGKYVATVEGSASKKEFEIKALETTEVVIELP